MSTGNSGNTLNKKSLRIGISGTRGIPNAYGGFEQFAEYLSAGLVAKGHQVWVYNSHLHPYQQKEWKGVHIIHCKDWEDKIGTAGQFVYDLNCIKDAGKRSFDILLQLGYTSSSIWYGLWPKTACNIVNMDGLEWKRTKYNNLVKLFLKKAEALAAKHADVLIADSIGIQDHLKLTFNKSSIYIPYGAEIYTNTEIQFSEDFNLKQKEYFLLIARFEPENNLEEIIKGYLASESRQPLAIIGNHKNTYGRYLKSKYNNPGIKYMGAIYNQPLINSIRYNCLIYFHGHSVGGTNPSLLEAMACSCIIAAHDNVFNKSILGDDAFYFNDSHDVQQIMNFQPNLTKEEWTLNNIEKIKSIYNWENIINSYENVFLKKMV